MAASSAPVVKSNLLTILAARPGLSGVGISWSHPGAALQQEHLWLGTVQNTDEQVALGSKARTETYTVQVIVYCVQDGNDAQAVETRWWQLVGEVEKAIQADSTIGGAVNLYAILTGWEQRSFTATGQRGTEGEIILTCQHRK